MRTEAGLSLIMLLAGCSTSGATSPTASVATTSTSAPTASAPSASASSASSPTELAPALALRDERLLELVPVDAACTSTEGIGSGQHPSHSFDVYAPRVAQPELEKAFVARAGTLGYTVAPQVGGLGFRDESRAVWATLNDAHISVVEAVAPAVDATMSAVTRSGVEAAALVGELIGPAPQYRVTFERSKGGLVLSVEVPTTPSNKARVDTWAKTHALTPDDRGWVRRRDAAKPDVHGMLIDVREDRLSLYEYVGVPPECPSHPSRTPREEAPRSGDSKNFTKEQLDLLKEMMPGP